MSDHSKAGRAPMTRRARLAALAVAVLAIAVAVAPSMLAAQTGPSGEPARPAWVASWAAMPQLTEPGNMPPAAFRQPGRVMSDTTLRQTVHVSLGADEIRLRFSNAFGGAALPLTRAAVALPAGGKAGVSAIQAGSSRPVTFGGRQSTVVPVGALVVSDPIRMHVPAGSNVAVTVYLAEGQASEDITSHPGSRTTSHLLHGDATDAADLPGATRVDHWYFLSNVEVRSPGSTAVAVVGDSLTDGRGSTTNGNDRWPDQLFERLQRPNVAIVNQAAGGNRVLNDGLGPNVLARFDRDVIAQSGVESVIVFEGVNDIGTADATLAAQQAVADDLIAAFQQLVTRAHAQGIRVYGATITPFGGFTLYDDPGGLRERTREAVNRWIRTSGELDAVLDFDRAVRDPAEPRRLLPAYDTGDHLHLSPTGDGAIADAVPLELMR